MLLCVRIKVCYEAWLSLNLSGNESEVSSRQVKVLGRLTEGGELTLWLRVALGVLVESTR